MLTTKAPTDHNRFDDVVVLHDGCKVLRILDGLIISWSGGFAAPPMSALVKRNLEGHNSIGEGMSISC